MKHLLMSLLFVLCQSELSMAEEMSKPLTDNQLQTAATLRDSVLVSNEAWSIVESLTTEVGARAGGSAGDALAVQWAQDKFKSLGFKNIRIEPVTFPSWKRGIEVAHVIAPFKQRLVITALGNSIATPDNGLQGEIIHYSTLTDLINADADDVAGKIVFISKRMKAFRDGHDYGKTVPARSSGAKEAAKKDAIGILIRSVGTDSNRVAHTGNMSYDKDIKKIPAAALSNPDADLLINMLKRKVPVIVNFTLTSEAGEDYTSYNVIGEIVGTEKPEEIILIGGHLDSWDLGTGAIDDGAGVAITMAAAYKISLMPTQPKRTIRVVLFANEEQGLFGGEQYAIAHLDELQKHIVGAESDFGAGKIWKFSTKFKPSAKALGHQIHSVLEPLGIEYGDNKAGGGPDIIHSKKAGMAVATLSQDGIDYFDYHHTANDTLDKINPENLSQNVAAYAAFVWLMTEIEGDVGFFPPDSK